MISFDRRIRPHECSPACALTTTMRTTARYSLGTWLARVLVVMAVVWLALFLIHVSLPNVRPGAELVSNAKTRIIASERLFPDNARRRVVLLGNSKTLAGFDPVL